MGTCFFEVNLKNTAVIAANTIEFKGISNIVIPKRLPIHISHADQKLRGIFQKLGNEKKRNKTINIW